MSKWLQRIIISCTTLFLELTADILTFSVNRYSPEVITATNQYYLVLCLVVMGTSVTFRTFRKYSPHCLSLGSLFSQKVGKAARTLNFGVLLVLTLELGN